MTETDNNDDVHSQIDPQQANLGEMLRQAREQRELSQEDLARCLRLEPRVIRFLENNQFDQLPVPAFVRGYVRSIAKELGIDSAPLITVLELRFEGEPPPLSDFKSRAPTQITSDSNIIRYTTITLIIALVIMVALWWRAHNDDALEIDRLDAGIELAPVEPATAPLSYSFDIVTHPKETFPGPQAPPSALPQTALEAPDAPLDAAQSSGAEDDAALDEAAVVVITVREEAWVDARDAHGTRLYYDLARPGRELRLAGQPPYALTIGNADAVSVNFDGRVVDLKQYNVDGIARLNLGSTSANP